VVVGAIVVLAASGCREEVGAADRDEDAGALDDGTAGAPDGDVRSPCQGPCPDAGGRPVPLPRPECPNAEPVSGSGCDRTGLICGYGDGYISLCRSIYLCSEGTWKRDTVFGQSYRCREVPPGYCPSVPPAWVSGCTISEAGTPFPCAYDGLLCFCKNPGGVPGGPGNWTCYGPPANPQCPANLPNIGEGCDTPGVQCNYPAGLCPEPPHTNVFCYEGKWEDGVPNSCPL
jgi:hypothetical protein